MKKSFLSGLSVAFLLLGALASCGESGSSTATGEKKASFTYWIPTGVDGQYYSDYKDNPVVRYLTNYKKWGKDKDVSISFDFTVPPTGEENNNLSTLLGSGDYTDVIDTSYYKSMGTVKNLYEEGIAMDLTSYVKEYMPNYLAWLEKNPDQKKRVINKIDGEDKYLEIFSMADSSEPWGGWEYRRDWIVKYGVNPKTQAAFTGSYDANGVWSDDVVFPSENKDPIYISDWEWMLKIFKKAIEDQGISDGYPFSMAYQGFYETGDLYSSFGGTGPFWSVNQENKIEFGPQSQHFKAYLQAMNNWYKNGYIDKKFSERTSDSFYQINTTGVYSGKIGLWYGYSSETEKAIQSGEDDFTKGACVMGCRQPINDVYGTDSDKNIVPYTFYQGDKLGSSIVITNKAKDKDIPALMSFIDFMYSPEGAVMKEYGLSKAQYEECQDPLYTKYGLTEGGYSQVDSDGNPWVEGTSQGEKMYRLCDFLVDHNNIAQYFICSRFNGYTYGPSRKFYTFNPIFIHTLKEWMAITVKSPILDTVTSQLSSDDSLTYSSAMTRVREFTAKYTPDYVKGVKDYQDLTAYNSALSKYKVDQVSEMLQKGVDSFLG